MAIVILGGLLSATALNMIVLPALYWIFGEREVEVRQNELADQASGLPMVPAMAK